MTSTILSAVMGLLLAVQSGADARKDVPTSFQSVEEYSLINENVRLRNVRTQTNVCYQAAHGWYFELAPAYLTRQGVERNPGDAYRAQGCKEDWARGATLPGLQVITPESRTLYVVGDLCAARPQLVGLVGRQSQPSLAKLFQTDVSFMRLAKIAERLPVYDIYLSPERQRQRGIASPIQRQLANMAKVFEVGCGNVPTTVDLDFGYVHGDWNGAMKGINAFGERTVFRERNKGAFFSLVDGKVRKVQPQLSWVKIYSGEFDPAEQPVRLAHHDATAAALFDDFAAMNHNRQMAHNQWLRDRKDNAAVGGAIVLFVLGLMGAESPCFDDDPDRLKPIDCGY